MFKVLLPTQHIVLERITNWLGIYMLSNYVIYDRIRIYVEVNDKKELVQIIVKLLV